MPQQDPGPQDGDLALRLIYHQREDRIDSHILISFLAYSLHVTLKARLRLSAAVLTPRAVLETFEAVQMLEVHIPTPMSGRLFSRAIPKPEQDLQLLLDQLKMQLPDQPPPKITRISAKR